MESELIEEFAGIVKTTGASLTLLTVIFDVAVAVLKALVLL